MFYKKKGYPEVGEIVMCTVKKILHHCVFIILDEYENLEGMLYISEIAPGRIRNIRDYVKEGKKIVCKILRINLEKKHIDLSLRRVNLAQKRNKNDEYKQEQKAEKLLEGIGVKFKLDIRKMYEKAGNAMIKRFGTLTDCFYAVVEDDFKVEELGIDKKMADAIVSVVKEKIKPVEVSISGEITLMDNSGDGVEKIKKILDKMSHIKDYEIKISYMGAPKYSINVTAGDYKEAEEIMNESVSIGEKMAKETGSEFSFKRLKN